MATVVFGGAGANGLYNRDGDGGTLTLAPTVLVRGNNGTLYGDYLPNGQLINQGMISADVSGNTLMVQGVTNQGTLAAVNGGNLKVSNLTNQGTISALNSTLLLDDEWNNAGTISTNNATTFLGGSFNPANLGKFIRTGGEVDIIGTLDLALTTLTLDA